MVQKKPLRMTFGVLAVIAALGEGGWVAVTGHASGKLVYQYGLGVPDRVAEVESIDTTEHAPDHEHEN